MKNFNWRIGLVAVVVVLVAWMAYDISRVRECRRRGGVLIHAVGQNVCVKLQVLE